MDGSFVEQVADMLPKDNAVLSRTCVILPTKRACIYFQKALLNRWPSESIWLPEILSLQEFLHRETPVDISPEEDLLAILYQVHERVTGHSQPLSGFYKWGQMILKDFNDIDQYLVDPDYIFQYVEAFKKIENDSRLTPQQVSWLQQFWNAVPQGESSRIRDNFLKTWKHLGSIYRLYREELMTGGRGYEGMAYRLLLETLESGDKGFGHKHFHLVGFNALSAFEERLFSHLVESYDTNIYWDAGDDLIKEGSEAGLFIRRYISRFEGAFSHQISPAAHAEGKQIDVIDAGMDAGQCQTALELAGKWGSDDTVVVLCDESLVVPMIFQLSEERPANITMGFPLALSSYQSFLKKLCYFKENMSSSGRPNSLLLLNILKFAQVRQLLEPSGLKHLEEAIGKRGYIGEAEIRGFFESGDTIVGDLLSTGPILEYIQNILGRLQVGRIADDSESIILQACIREVEGLGDWLDHNHLKLEAGEVSKLIEMRLATTRIPFGGDAKEELQIMGFLETRNLDFRNVIVLGASDEHLPGTSKTNSFIPYTIRKGLGMPTYHENDAIYGYHFFRLLQRADNIALVYSQQSAGQKLSRSRFIEQIIYEWGQKPGIEIHERRIHLPVPRTKAAEPVQINKRSNAVEKGLEAFLKGERQLSASAINTYIRCPFQFYLKYIAGLEEVEELSADLDQRDLGKIFHKAMELFYRPFLESGQLISREILEAHKKQAGLESLIVKAFEAEHYSLPRSGVKGKNLLVKRMILAMMDAVVDCDMKSEPFRIAGLELRMEKLPFALGGGREILLKGFLDRVDHVESADGKHIRIVDYKTGSVRILSRKNKTPEEYYDKFFSDPVYKEGMQAYLYAWMYDKMHPGNEIRAGFYTARELSSGLKYLQGGQPVTDEDYSIFEDKLHVLLQEMFDLSTPFIQSEDEQAYKYSSFDVLVG